MTLAGVAMASIGPTSAAGSQCLEEPTTNRPTMNTSNNQRTRRPAEPLTTRRTAEPTVSLPDMLLNLVLNRRDDPECSGNPDVRLGLDQDCARLSGAEHF